MKLHLHVKSCYFEEIKAGVKKHEYRLANEYWRKRLLGRSYDAVVIYNAYKPGPENRLEFPWNGVGLIANFTHPHFGAESVTVYSVPVFQ